MSGKKLVESWFKNIDSQDFEAVGELMADEHTFHSPMSPTPIKAIEHLDMMWTMSDSFSGIHLLDQVIEDGNNVVVRGRWAGKHTREYHGIPASGKKVEFSWIDIFEIVDGKVVNEYFEMDPTSIIEQITNINTQKTQS
ncbi:hypothetical protein FUAX_02470 [Fulvitalea axinellae]|uniref:Ester cyclase n=1 Tax=Fulvitalea axinellae TaxID=1182444 RepID=A0AAU9D6M1_9BACT|nr:hypothetical protein FUAX_02470 [Fulvitalea axinellae]